jgi:hypothetical protein
MIPLYLKTTGDPPRGDPLYYLIAANGAFLVKRSALFVSVTAAETVMGLAHQDPAITLNFPKLPRSVVEDVLGFFRAVYRRWHGEAVAFLFYAPETQEFRVDVPFQILRRHRTRDGWRTYGHVEYGAIDRPQGFLKLGDAHSHANVPAFFSDTDVCDDREDGLRLVFGRLGGSGIDVRVSFVANGCRFALEPDEVLDLPPGPLLLRAPPNAWIERVVCRDETVDPPSDSTWVSYGL